MTLHRIPVRQLAWATDLHLIALPLQHLPRQETEVRVHDYIDGAVPMLSRMFDKRRRGYEAVGYTIRDDTAPTFGAMSKI